MLAALPEMAGLRLRWVQGGNSYCPVLQFNTLLDATVIVENLHAALQILSGHYVITMDRDLKIPHGVFREIARQTVEDFLGQKDMTAVAIMAAFGCDAITNEDGTIEDTAFRTMSGAGHQHFLEFMNILAKETSKEQVHEALFGPWRYRDPSPIMRWDAEDDRRYSLRWDEPSKDPVRTVRGANLLAIAALPLFPTVPVSSSELGTTAFKGTGSRDTFVTWPIWSEGLSLDATRSVLGLQALQDDNVTAISVAPLGIDAVYRSQRITLGKYRNFTPAQSL